MNFDSIKLLQNNTGEILSLEETVSGSAQPASSAVSTRLPGEYLLEFWTHANSAYANERVSIFWSKETPPPGGVSYLLCSLIKNRV